MRIDLFVDGHPVVIRDLEPADEPAVLAVFAASDDWFLAATGQPSAPGDVQSAYYSLPEGYDFEDKVLLVIEAAREVVGFVDALRQYPHIASVGIGTFLIRPEYRRLGIGRAVAAALSAAAVEQDIVQISTHVVEGWVPGRKFLATLGATFSPPAVPGGAGNRTVGPHESARKVIPATIAIG
ncbi:GNAT family N-acetyltransferase [Catenulispora sp. NF23]|uniref:GNAT family N-acetyltransferase n=1 Tax=Catenulispora pinistramenti TaxID=2705254 RepID=UPI001BA6F836|nr:GNAT family N-acetyltransferase [Catenulispora pinistramenti]MBS2539543.1 GNAT family N-acetyltransferase [Catenulispora pinistramenti]